MGSPGFEGRTVLRASESLSARCEGREWAGAILNRYRQMPVWLQNVPRSSIPIWDIEGVGEKIVMDTSKTYRILPYTKGTVHGVSTLGKVPYFHSSVPSVP